MSLASLLWQYLTAEINYPLSSSVQQEPAPFCALDRSDSDLVQVLRRDCGPPGLGSLSVIGEVGGSCRVAAEEPLSPVNGSSLDGGCSESACARVSMALVVSSDPCRSSLWEVAIVSRALSVKGLATFRYP